MKGLKQPDKIITYPCHGEKGNQEWLYDQVKKSIKHKVTGLCIELNESNKLVMNNCDDENSRQKWFWQINTKQI